MSLFIELQKTLSFYEPMSLEMIFIDLDEGFLKANSELTTEDLLAELRLMEKKKIVTKTKKDGQYYWQKNKPKKPWYKRLVFIPFKK